MKTELLDDEIIAQFMGLKRHDPDKDYWKAQYYKPDPKDARKKGDFVNYFDHLEYSTSWEWFMPAYRKFSSLEFEEWDLIHADHCASIAEKVLSFDLIGANEKLVEGIKWYNDSHPKAVKK